MADPIKEASDSGWIAKHRDLYLANGEDGHMWDSAIAGGPGPIPTLLLFTIGRKSGKESIMPLIYGEIESGVVIIASKGGNPSHPGWYHNLMNQIEVKVQVKNDVYKAKSRIISGDERERVWKMMAELYPPYSDYQSATERHIPVIALERL